MSKMNESFSEELSQLIAEQESFMSAHEHREQALACKTWIASTAEVSLQYAVLVFEKHARTDWGAPNPRPFRVGHRQAVSYLTSDYSYVHIDSHEQILSVIVMLSRLDERTARMSYRARIRSDASNQERLADISVIYPMPPDCVAALDG